MKICGIITCHTIKEIRRTIKNSNADIHEIRLNLVKKFDYEMIEKLLDSIEVPRKKIILADKGTKYPDLHKHDTMYDIDFEDFPNIGILPRKYMILSIRPNTDNLSLFDMKMLATKLEIHDPQIVQIMPRGGNINDFEQLYEWWNTQAHINGKLIAFAQWPNGGLEMRIKPLRWGAPFIYALEPSKRPALQMPEVKIVKQALEQYQNSK